MQNDFKRLIALVETEEPSSELLHDTMLRINVKKKKTAAYMRIGFFGAVATVALIGLVPVWNEFYAEFVQSGFTSLASLFFSDAGTIVKYWQDFLLSLAESLPILSAIGVVGSIFIFLFSAEHFLRNVRALTRKNYVAI